MAHKQALRGCSLVVNGELQLVFTIAASDVVLYNIP